MNAPTDPTPAGKGLVCRDARDDDRGTVWQILEPVLRAGETYALPQDWSAADALAYWFQPSHQVRIAERSGTILGTYYLMPNQLGGGDHVANCGYVTALSATGQGIATAMCLDSLKLAKRRGFRAIQFNFVLESNHRAVGLWKKLGFKEIGKIPKAFRHPSKGFVSALVMWRSLEDIPIEEDLRQR